MATFGGDYPAVSDRLKHVRNHRWGWTAQCPAHDDDRQSLSIKVGNAGDRLVVKCHAGCTFKEISAAIGLKPGDFFRRQESGRKDRKRMESNGKAAGSAAAASRQQNGQRRIVATYDYVDELRRPLFQVVRYEPKGFAQRRSDGRGGWVWGLEGVRVVPYRLDKLAANLKAEKPKPVWVVEGEKDVATLERYGLLATTNPAGALKWRPEFADYLADCAVNIVPDNDPFDQKRGFAVGAEHARLVAESLRGKAASCKIINLPGLAAKQDVSDWLNGGGTADELVKLAEAADYVFQRPRPEKDGHCGRGPELTAEQSLILEGVDRLASRATRMEPADWCYFAAGVLEELRGKLRK